MYLTSGFSQETPEINYVKNSSFEQTLKEPCYWIRSPREFYKIITDWKLPTSTTSDVFSVTAGERCWANPLKQSGGKQMPHTGNKMMGIKTQGNGDDGAVACWHEYVETKLITKLENGKEYYIEFWVMASFNSTKFSNNIGVLFTDTLINTKNRVALYLTPHINQDKLLSDRQNWTKISAIFLADKDYDYITIGNFYHDIQTITEKVQGRKPGAYYYIDDVLVRPKQKGDKGNTGKPATVILPQEKKPLIEDIPEQTTEEKPVTSIDYELGTTVVLNNIYFKTDKAKLLPESMDELNKLYDLLSKHNAMKIQINGHTDNIGTDEYNKNLSKNRAKAVADYLISKNINAERISHKGFGSGKPIKTNLTEEGRSKNRRVEFKIVE